MRSCKESSWMFSFICIGDHGLSFTSVRIKLEPKTCASRPGYLRNLFVSLRRPFPFVFFFVLFSLLVFIFTSNNNSQKNEERERRHAQVYHRLTPTEEKQISFSLQTAWRDKIHSLLTTSLPEHEQRILKRLMGPSDTICGIGMGVVSFLSLRGMRARVLLRLLSFKSSLHNSVQHSPFQPSRRRRKGALFHHPLQADLVGESSKWKILDLLLDVSASSCLGI